MFLAWALRGQVPVLRRLTTRFWPARLARHMAWSARLDRIGGLFRRTEFGDAATERDQHLRFCAGRTCGSVRAGRAPSPDAVIEAGVGQHDDEFLAAVARQRIGGRMVSRTTWARTSAWSPASWPWVSLIF